MRLNNYDPDEEEYPGPTDNDFQGNKDSDTFTKVDYEEETGRIDVYYGERGSSAHGHIVTHEDSTADYVRDDDGEVHRDR